MSLAYNLGFRARELRLERRIVLENADAFLGHGMSISHPKPGERVVDVRFEEDTLSVDLIDGRTITAPLA